MTKNILKLLFISIVLICACGSKESADASKPEAKDFTLPTLEGQEITLSGLKGKVVLIDFWATWCPPCRQSVPVLTTLYNKHKEKGFIVLGIGLDDEDKLIKFKEDKQVPYPILLGTKQVAQTYGVKGIPKMLILDKKGEIRKTQVGFAPELESMFDAFIDSLLKE
jgi:peroxiredoxin